MASPSDKRRTVDDILGGSGGGINDLWDKTAAAGDDFEPIPAGTYHCILTDGRVTESLNGKPSYKIEFTIVDGLHANRKLWLDCWLTPDAIHLAKRDLVKLRINQPEQLRQAPPTGLLADVRVALRTREDGSTFNRVNGFKVVADAPPSGILDADDEDGPAEAGPADTDNPVPF